MNLIELNAQEVEETEGGFVLVIIGSGINGYLALAYYDHGIGHGN
jgi:hypothetical protein